MNSNLGPNPAPNCKKCVIDENNLPKIPSSLFETNLQGVNPLSASDVFGFGDGGGDGLSLIHI